MAHMEDDVGPRPSKKRKGGLVQRMQRVEEDLQKDSALYGLLMTYLARGIISGVMTHSLAQAAAKDLTTVKEGYSLPDLEQMAKLSQGRNLIRQVHNQLNKTTILPAPFHCRIPYKDGVHPGSILLPHEMFSAFFSNVNFWKNISPSTEKLSEWWLKFDGHPLVENHPIKAKGDYRTVYPLWVTW